MKTTEEYKPFGEEWKAEMMKMRKADIIEFYKKALCSFQGDLSKPFQPAVSEDEIEAIGDVINIVLLNDEKTAHKLINSQFNVVSKQDAVSEGEIEEIADMIETYFKKWNGKGFDKPSPLERQRFDACAEAIASLNVQGEGWESVGDVKHTIGSLQSKHDAFLGTQGETSRRSFKSGLSWAIESLKNLIKQ